MAFIGGSFFFNSNKGYLSCWTFFYLTMLLWTCIYKSSSICVDEGFQSLPLLLPRSLEVVGGCLGYVYCGKIYHFNHLNEFQSYFVFGTL